MATTHSQLNGPPAVSAPVAPAGPAFDATLFLNRELSWLDFNERVLEEARDPSNPLLDRLKFLAICASNLDEFFEVRVAGLQAQLYENLEPQDMPPDGMGPLAQLLEIARRAHDFVARLYETWLQQIHPQLREHGIRICPPGELTPAQNDFLDDYFDSQVYPVLTPLAIDPAHPFPHVHNKSLNLLLRIESLNQHGRLLYAVLQVPSVINRLVPLPDEGDAQRRFVLLEDVIGPRLDALFGGYRVIERVAFRATRNSDLSIQENEVKSSLLSTIEETLRQRKWGAPVRLEISERADEGFLAQLLSASALELEERDVYKVAGPVDLTALAGLYRLEGFRELKEPPFDPQMPACMATRKSVFTAIREGDILVHHPYESFGTVVQFIEQASEDPQVLAIKMTLYRTAESNPIINALARAAENGKQVTALVELQARLDEENNIDKARMLQKAGVHVVYGIVGLKTHCKAALVVRREHDGIR
ncbi:MAG: polyphosphate kinase 1, partial [Isosphaeraceae bacterium]